MRYSAMLAAQSQSLGMTWSNFDGTSTIYLTGEVADINVITIAIVNNLGSDVVIPLGELPAGSGWPAGQCGIYIDFSGLLDAAQIAAVTVSAGWTAQAVSDQGTPYLGLLPAQQTTIPDASSLAFTLKGVASSPALVGYPALVSATLAGATYDDGTALPAWMAPQAPVNVQNPKLPGNAELALSVGFAGTNLVLTENVMNELVLYLTNPSQTALVPGGATAWGAKPPAFVLSFVYGDTAEALTSVSAGGSIEVAVGAPVGLSWEPATLQNQSSAPSWLLAPNPSGGGTVLGTGPTATVAFTISDIQTQLAAGLTFAYLSCSYIPNYNDGFYALEIVKIDPIVNTSFSAGTASAPDAVGGMTVPLSFEVSGATSVLITNTAYAATAIDGTLSDSVSPYVTTTAAFTLVATNAISGQVLTQTVVVDVPTDHLVPTGTIVMWSGSAAAVPTGWWICDGSGGTPDLRNRFVCGTDGVNGAPINGVGGSAMHNHSTAAAVTVASNGDHTHQFPSNWTSESVGHDTPSDSHETIWPGGTYDGSVPTQDSGTHTHVATAVVTNLAAATLPPWYALCYIMKTA